MTELNRVETTTIALNVGIAYPWAENHVMANGLCGQKHPLGNALVHLLAHPNGINARLVTQLLASSLVRSKRCGNKESWDIADQALTWWFDPKCPTCKGRGVLNFQQEQCPACHGKGRREYPSKGAVRDAIGFMEAEIEGYEGHLAAKLRG